MRTLVDVVGFELGVGEREQDGAVEGQGVDCVVDRWLSQPPPEGGEPDGMGEVIEARPSPVR